MSCPTIASNPIRSAEAIPQIAVIVPAYGVAHLLAEAIDSLLAQDFADWEAIVIDDGAPDDVAGAVAPYLADPRIRLVETENHGVSAARNLAISMCRAPLIALLDGDDLLAPSYLTRMVDAMEADPYATIATCNARIFGVIPTETLSIPDHCDMPETASAIDLMKNDFSIYIGSTFRRRDWKRIGGFDSAMTHAEDLDFWLRLLLAGGHARYINAVLGHYRVRGNSASANNLALINGRIKLFEKVVTAHAGSPEAAFAQKRLVSEYEDARLETAIVATIAGDLAMGLTALRSERARFKGPIWALSFSIWQVFPKLAPAMLAWRMRRHAHSVAGNAFVQKQAV